MPLVADGMAALLSGGVFAAAHFVTKGAVCLSVFVCLAAALVWAVATRRSISIPLVPWLLLSS